MRMHGSGAGHPLVHVHTLLCMPSALRRARWIAAPALTVALSAALVLAGDRTARATPLPARADTVPGDVHAADVPFSVGEELVYSASFGFLHAGTGRMRVQSIDTIRGRPAYHVEFTLDGGIPFFRVHDRYESWIDIETLSSLRYIQTISEGRYHRHTVFEIFPDRAEYQKNDEPPQPSVSNPLDDGSFIYAIRAAGVKVGETRSDGRYFKPEANPVVLTGLRFDTVTVNAGTFPSTVVRPTIKTSGIFSEHGDAQVWFSDDAHRYPVQLKTHFSKFSLTLSLQSVTPGA